MNGMVICAENLKAFTKSVLEPRARSKVTGYKINEQRTENKGMRFKNKSPDNTDKSMKKLHFFIDVQARLT